jgi:hypothetical protein
VKAQQERFLLGQYNQLLLYPPIVFSIDSKSVKTELYNIQGTLVQSSADVGFFISKKLSEIMLNPNFVLKSKSGLGDVKTTHPNLTVWLWSRSLSSSFSLRTQGFSTDYELINLSPFIESLNVTSNMEGASFSFSIAPIKTSLGKFPEGWKIKKDSVSFNNSKTNPEYRAISHTEDKDLKSKDFFFHNVIQQNDLIFISFEDLAFEENPFRSDLSVPFKGLNQKIWDLIGLVDNNEISISKDGQNEVSINISGRDLTKLIIEDGSYFWATEFGLDGTIRFAGNRDNRIAKRIEAKGFINSFSIANKSIEDSLRFIIGQLANTGLVPNDVFSNYGNRRSTIFVEEVTGRETISSSANAESGDSLNLKTQVNIKLQKQLKEVVADGVWGITKIIVDPQIANLRLVDSALFTEQGSFINYINRICQKPFVEFYTETIADEFYWIARKSPHNKKSITNSIEGIFVQYRELSRVEKSKYTKIITERNSGSASMFGGEFRTNSFVIDIEQLDTIRMNLRFDERAYSWYKFEPRYAFGGSQNNVVSLALLPAVFLPTYTNLYGSRPLNLSSNYVNYIPSNGADNTDNYLNAIEQAYYDLAWLIETNSYLPFTRTGTITIKEDRRIKKGMFIRLKSTDEIFLVNQVSHSISTGQKLDRTTTLQVERGMVEKYIKGAEVEGYGQVGYFDLVKTPIDFIKLRSGAGGGEKYQPINDWEENKRCIDFFLQRRQFE